MSPLEGRTMIGGRCYRVDVTGPAAAGSDSLPAVLSPTDPRTDRAVAAWKHHLVDEITGLLDNAGTLRGIDLFAPDAALSLAIGDLVDDFASMTWGER